MRVVVVLIDDVTFVVGCSRELASGLSVPSTVWNRAVEIRKVEWISSHLVSRGKVLEVIL